MIPLYNPVALWATCVFTGGSVGMLYSLATMWRFEKRRRSSREPFAGVDLGALPEPARQLVSDALALRGRKPTSSWSVLVGVVLPAALSYHLYQIALGFGHHTALPVVLMNWPSLILTMSAGACLIPVVGLGCVNMACWKIKQDVRKRRKALTG